MKHVWFRFALCSGLLGSLLAAGAARASGLQVVPTTLVLKASQKANGLWLSNIGDSVVHAQVRVYHWTQDSQGDQLVSSTDLAISPPMLRLEVGDHRLIRVIRLGAPPSGAGAVEDAYRLAIDELPIEAKGKKGLQFVLHYSVPVFVEAAEADQPTPQLQWSLERNGKQVMLQVSNHGNRHAQLSALSYIDGTGNRTEITPGLLGYVLPGATMRWMLAPAAAVFSSGGNLEAMINGQMATQKLSLADRPR